MKYKIISSKLIDMDFSIENKTIYESDDFNECLIVLKTYSKNHEMELYHNKDKDVLLDYVRKEGSVIVEHLLLIQND